MNSEEITLNGKTYIKSYDAIEPGDMVMVRPNGCDPILGIYIESEENQDGDWKHYYTNCNTNEICYENKSRRFLKLILS